MLYMPNHRTFWSLRAHLPSHTCVVGEFHLKACNSSSKRSSSGDLCAACFRNHPPNWSSQGPWVAHGQLQSSQSAFASRACAVSGAGACHHRVRAIAFGAIVVDDVVFLLGWVPRLISLLHGALGDSAKLQGGIPASFNPARLRAPQMW